jgi:hypothetical protein
VSVSATGDYNEPKGTVFTEALADTAARNSLAITPGRYLFAVTCRVPGTNVATGFFLGRLWFYDSLRWLNQDPAVVGVPTTTTVTVAPSGRQVVSNKVEINAILDPADSSGSVVFEAVSGTSILPVGAATIKNGTATFSVSNLDLGLYYLTGTYTPDGTNNPGHNGSHSKEIILAITKGLPPIPAREAAVTGTAKVGSKLTCASGFSGQQVSVTYQWFRDGAAVAGSAVTRTSVAADAGHLLTCRATATNPGGTVYRDSPAVRVGV